LPEIPERGMLDPIQQYVAVAGAMLTMLLAAGLAEDEGICRAVWSGYAKGFTSSAHDGASIAPRAPGSRASFLNVAMTRVPHPGADSTLNSAPTAAARSRMIISPQPWSLAG